MKISIFSFTVEYIVFSISNKNSTEAVNVLLEILYWLSAIAHSAVKNPLYSSCIVTFLYSFGKYILP